MKRLGIALAVILLVAIEVGACHDIGHGVQGMGRGPSPDIRFFVMGGEQ